MKKSLVVIAALLVTMIGMPAISASAQRGEKSLVINGGYASQNNSGYANVAFHYTFANHFRIAPDMGYVFRNQGSSAYLLDVDMHFPFRVGKGIGLYPLAGFAYNNWSVKHGRSASRAGGNFGGGLDLYLTSNLKFNVQAKYTLVNDYSGVYVGLGIGYVF